jgi:hypothetical protein
MGICPLKCKDSTEGDGVGAALGGEVAAEAEHVRPRGQPQLLELGELAEAEACGDVAAGVFADWQVGEPGSGEGPGTGPGAARLPETGQEMATRTRASRCHQLGDRGNEEQDQPLTATMTATMTATAAAND